MKYLLFLPLLLLACSEDDQPACNSPMAVVAETIGTAYCSQANGSVTLATADANGPVTYRLGDGPAQTSPTFASLSPGSYRLTVQDEAGCTATTSVTIPDEDAELTVAAAIVSSACGESAGRIALEVSGGAAPYQFSLDSADFTDDATLNRLAPGTYSVTVRDANGCTASVDARVLSGISFETTIHPIITTNCAITGCHVSGRAADFSVRENIFAYAEHIRERTSDRSMPLGRELTDEEIAQINCWVNDGAPDN